MLDLDHVEVLIRNPASASPDRDMLLALVAECRRLRSERVVVDAHIHADPLLVKALDFSAEQAAVERAAEAVFPLPSKPEAPPPVVEVHESKPKRGKK